MAKIILLDENTINQIAAGEVVERPASVVKELVENSIDAGAKKIRIDIKNGGIKLIRITDDGSGISSDDFNIAFERHSTSKIYNVDDLQTIKTMGFRGEALASIASVSEMEITTRTRDESKGLTTSVVNGEVGEIKQIGCPVGTTISVKDLFYNVPARYKFLKSDSNELRRCTDILTRISLGNPGVSIGLYSMGTEVFRTPGNNDVKSAIYNIYGKEISSKINEIDYQDDNIRITGYIGLPSIAKGNKSSQSFFVNKRYIKDKIIGKAVQTAFSSRLMHNRFPFAVIFIEINPKLIDVNVHPSKTEIRFWDEKALFNAIYTSVNNALSTSSDIISFSNIVKEKIDDIYIKKDKTKIVEQLLSEPTIVEYLKNKDDESNMKIDEIITENVENIEEDIKEDIKPKLSDYSISGYLLNTYILIEKGSSIIYIDQHAAHERINYDLLLSDYRNGKNLTQTLLEPYSIEITSAEMLKVTEFKDVIKSVGFEYEPFGINTILITGVPFIGANISPSLLFSDILDELSLYKNNQHIKTIEKFFYSISCRSSVMANQKLEELEIKELIRKLDEVVGPLTCPHGRPILIEMTKKDIEKMFKRIL